MKSSRIKLLQAELLRWYAKNARDLPWRRTNDPYKIWVSEIMLQQTQVATVIEYYEHWIKRFPTVKKLAQAPQEIVLKHWAGLGYYRRARMLHEAAKVIVQKYGAEIPASTDELMKLPGIGRYSAGAIASIAFGRSTPVLDGNVIRILTRIEAIADDVGDTQTLKGLWAMAESLVPLKKPGDFNQAMMELGATVCMPDNPRCLICPVSRFCRAFKTKSPARFPVKKNKQRLEKLQTAALILKRNSRVLILQQPQQARWGGLWMFPHWQDRKSMLNQLALKSDSLKKRLRIKHGFTKYSIELDVYECEMGVKGMKKDGVPDIFTRPRLQRRLSPSVKEPGTECKTKWVPIEHLNDYAFPSPHKKIVSDLLNNGHS